MSQPSKSLKTPDAELYPFPVSLLISQHNNIPRNSEDSRKKYP